MAVGRAAGDRNGDVPHPDIVCALGGMADTADDGAAVDHGEIVFADRAKGEGGHAAIKARTVCASNRPRYCGR